MRNLVLVYNLDNTEKQSLISRDFNILEIDQSNAGSTLRDIIEDGVKKDSSKLPNEKVILFHNYDNNELQDEIKKIRATIKGGILAVVTETSIEWTFEYLVEHLIEEREWFKNQKKGR